MMQGRATRRGEVAYSVLAQVRPLYQASARAVEDALVGTGLSTPLRAVVELLLTTGPLTVPQVASEFGITRQSVQPLVDSGLSAGLLELQDNPRHRRSRLVAPTQHGRNTFEAVHQRELHNLDRVTADLDPDDLAQCARVLAQLTERLGRLHLHDSQELP